MPAIIDGPAFEIVSARPVDTVDWYWAGAEVYGMHYKHVERLREFCNLAGLPIDVRPVSGGYKMTVYHDYAAGVGPTTIAHVLSQHTIFANDRTLYMSADLAGLLKQERKQ